MTHYQLLNFRWNVAPKRLSKRDIKKFTHNTQMHIFGELKSLDSQQSDAITRLFSLNHQSENDSLVPADQ